MYNGKTENEFRQLLVNLGACSEGLKFAKNLNWQQVYTQCRRGDWLLWLFARANPDNLQLLTLAKGHCAATVIFLMKDERSRKAVEVAILFGEGKATREELNAAAADAANANANANANADAAAAYAAADAAAAYAAAYAADAAYAAANASAAYAAYAYAAAKTENQQLTADLIRALIPIEKFNITF